jgi:zinc transport system substrate-binding protein
LRGVEGVSGIVVMIRRIAHLGLLMLASLGSTASAGQVVFTSIPPQKWLVESLAGDLVQTGVLLPPGASPATYEPTPKQMAALDRSQLYLRIGVPFENSLLDKISSLMPELQIVDCRVGVELEPMDSSAHYHAPGATDPHIWLDPERMKIIARNTATALKDLLPVKAPMIEERLDTLTRDLDETDHRVAAALAPLTGRRVIVFHPSFGYFTRRYGLIQTAIEFDGKAPSARRLASIVEEMGTRQARALFVQPQFSRSSATRVARALDCEIIELDPLAGNYLTNLEHMARQIAGALR